MYCLNKYRRVPTGFKDEIASHSTFNVKWVSEPVFAMLARLFSNDNRNGNHNFFMSALADLAKLEGGNCLSLIAFRQRSSWRNMNDSVTTNEGSSISHLINGL